ncbi:MAG: alanine racemase [Deltaproteobacteria bacterium]|nr:alanine racemase [Deltaproteobacteria bacterium]
MGTRPTVALIKTEALKHNYGQIRKAVHPSAKIMAVVKSNAYGHGDVEVAKTLENLGCESFGVACAEEGIRLREAGIKTPIVVLGGICLWLCDDRSAQARDVLDFALTPVISDIETARLLDGSAGYAGKTAPVHVEIDSGMGRLGLLPREITPFFREFNGLKNLRLEGVMSHFSEMDSEDKGYSKKQLDVFSGAVEDIKRMGCAPAYVHMANSAAVIDCGESHFNLVRPGIMLYGSYPSRAQRGRIDLRPVMQLVTRIMHIKKVPAGFPVSYGRTFVTEKESAIATIPIGYGDGLTRRLSGKGEVLVRGKRAPIAGNICMDHTMVDVTSVEGARVGDEVVVIGTQGNAEITADELAEKTGTISYEIFCAVSARVRRVVI